MERPSTRSTFSSFLKKSKSGSSGAKKVPQTSTKFSFVKSAQNEEKKKIDKNKEEMISEKKEQIASNKTEPMAPLKTPPAASDKTEPTVAGHAPEEDKPRVNAIANGAVDNINETNNRRNNYIINSNNNLNNNNNENDRGENREVVSVASTAKSGQHSLIPVGITRKRKGLSYARKGDAWRRRETGFLFSEKFTTETEARLDRRKCDNDNNDNYGLRRNDNDNNNGKASPSSASSSSRDEAVKTKGASSSSSSSPSPSSPPSPQQTTFTATTTWKITEPKKISSIPVLVSRLVKAKKAKTGSPTKNPPVDNQPPQTELEQQQKQQQQQKIRGEDSSDERLDNRPLAPRRPSTLDRTFDCEGTDYPLEHPRDHPGSPLDDHHPRNLNVSYVIASPDSEETLDEDLTSPEDPVTVFSPTPGSPSTPVGHDTLCSPSTPLNDDGTLSLDGASSFDATSPIDEAKLTPTVDESIFPLDLVPPSLSFPPLLPNDLDSTPLPPPPSLNKELDHLRPLLFEATSGKTEGQTNPTQPPGSLSTAVESDDKRASVPIIMQDDDNHNGDDAHRPTTTPLVQRVAPHQRLAPSVKPGVSGAGSSASAFAAPSLVPAVRATATATTNATTSKPLLQIKHHQLVKPNLTPNTIQGLVLPSAVDVANRREPTMTNNTAHRQQRNLLQQQQQQQQHQQQKAPPLASPETEFESSTEKLEDEPNERQLQISQRRQQQQQQQQSLAQRQQQQQQQQQPPNQAPEYAAPAGNGRRALLSDDDEQVITEDICFRMNLDANLAEIDFEEFDHEDINSALAMPARYYSNAARTSRHSLENSLASTSSELDRENSNDHMSLSGISDRPLFSPDGGARDLSESLRASMRVSMQGSLPRPDLAAVLNVSTDSLNLREVCGRASCRDSLCAVGGRKGSRPSQQTRHMTAMMRRSGSSGAATCTARTGEAAAGRAASVESREVTAARGLRIQTDRSFRISIEESSGAVAALLARRDNYVLNFEGLSPQQSSGGSEILSAPDFEGTPPPPPATTPPASPPASSPAPLTTWTTDSGNRGQGSDDSSYTTWRNVREKSGSSKGQSSVEEDDDFKTTTTFAHVTRRPSRRSDSADAHLKRWSMPELQNAAGAPLEVAADDAEDAAAARGTPDEEDAARNFNRNRTPRTRSDLTMDRDRNDLTLYKIFARGRADVDDITDDEDDDDDDDDGLSVESSADLMIASRRSDSSVFGATAAAAYDQLTDTPENVQTDVRGERHRVEATPAATPISAASTPSSERLHHATGAATTGRLIEDSDGRHTYTLSKGSGVEESPHERLVDDDDEDDDDDDYADLSPVQLRHPQRPAAGYVQHRHSQPAPADHHVPRQRLKSRSKSNHQGGAYWGAGVPRGHSAGERRNFFHPDGVPDYGGAGALYRDFSAPERARPESGVGDDWHLHMSAMALEMSAIARQCIQDTMKEIREQAMNIQVHVVPRTVSEQGIQFPEPVNDAGIQTSLVFAMPSNQALPKSSAATQTEGEFIFVPRAWLPDDVRLRLERQEKRPAAGKSGKGAARRAWRARPLPDLGFVNKHRAETDRRRQQPQQQPTDSKQQQQHQRLNYGTSPESGLLVRFERSTSSPAKFGDNVARVTPTYYNSAPLRRASSDQPSASSSKDKRRGADDADKDKGDSGDKDATCCRVEAKIVADAIPFFREKHSESCCARDGLSDKRCCFKQKQRLRQQLQHQLQQQPGLKPCLRQSQALLACCADRPQSDSALGSILSAYEQILGLNLLKRQGSDDITPNVVQQLEEFQRQNRLNPICCCGGGMQQFSGSSTSDCRGSCERESSASPQLVCQHSGDEEVEGCPSCVKARKHVSFTDHVDVCYRSPEGSPRRQAASAASVGHVGESAATSPDTVGPSSFPSSSLPCEIPRPSGQVSRAASDSPPTVFEPEASSSNEWSTAEGAAEVVDVDDEIIAKVRVAVRRIAHHFEKTRDPTQRAYLGNSHLCPYVGQLVLSDLCPTIHNVVIDGLRDAATPTPEAPVTAWSVAVRSARSHNHVGQIARTFEDLVKFIDHVTEGVTVTPLEKFYTFVMGLLNFRVLDQWFCSLATLPAAVMECYADEAFVMRLSPIPRDNGDPDESLLQRLLAALQPLTVLPFTLDLHLCADAAALLKKTEASDHLVTSSSPSSSGTFFIPKFESSSTEAVKGDNNSETSYGSSLHTFQDGGAHGSGSSLHAFQDGGAQRSGEGEAIIDRAESPEVLRRQKPILRPTSSMEKPSEEEAAQRVVYRHSRSLPGSPLRDATSSARKTWVGIGSQLLRQLDRWNLEGIDVDDGKIDEILAADGRGAKGKRKKGDEEGTGQRPPLDSTLPCRKISTGGATTAPQLEPSISRCTSCSSSSGYISGEHIFLGGGCGGGGSGSRSNRDSGEILGGTRFSVQEFRAADGEKVGKVTKSESQPTVTTKSSSSSSSSSLPPIPPPLSPCSPIPPSTPQSPSSPLPPSISPVESAASQSDLPSPGEDVSIFQSATKDCSYAEHVTSGSRRCVVALKDYSALRKRELSFSAGDVLVQLRPQDGNWIVCCRNSKHGLVPTEAVMDIGEQLL